DKNSSNGTSVNGRPLTPGVREELHSGDAVLMGRTTMVIRFDI
ncbi:MAG: FHA domain-containing protein, partial [Oscillospiraceae bacterium]|nr:FHA domain-containing protein [Oscillospiraceae bacterium]